MRTVYGSSRDARTWARAGSPSSASTAGSLCCASRACSPTTMLAAAATSSSHSSRHLKSDTRDSQSLAFPRGHPSLAATALSSPVLLPGYHPAMDLLENYRGHEAEQPDRH